jgi:spermidine/putrescine transport system substrate-binding protein
MTPKEGIISYCCGLVLTSEATAIDEAYGMMDALLAPQTGKWVIETLGYGHSNSFAFDLADEGALAAIGLPRDPTEIPTHGLFEREFPNPTALREMFAAAMSAA